MGLVLTPEGSVPGQYRRIGYFRKFVNSSDDYSYDPFKQATRDPKCHAPNDAYARTFTDDNGRQLKIINIV
ncbi:MAG: hypothetical protein CL912_07320 [Deltaproteobacteria bacterium]|nr:hypothetical protein [Deltaproteobacteria bacterium]